MKFLPLLFLLFVGCESDPYPEDADVQIRESKPQSDPADALSMVVSEKYTFYEGTSHDIRIIAFAEAPYKPELTVEGLPAGATFDSEKLLINWTPGQFDGNSPTNPGATSKNYYVTLMLRSDKPNSEVRVEVVTIEVMDVPLGIEYDGSDKLLVEEGDELSYEFTIHNTDYPQGPFDVKAIDFPAVIENVAGDPTKFRMTLKPDYHFVKITDPACSTFYGNHCVHFDGNIRITNPANHIKEQPFVLEVKDKRLEPKIVVPAKLTQGLNTSFQVSGYDLNGDNPPKIKLVSDAPTYGVFTELKPVKYPETNSSVLSIKWTDIPTTYNGSTVDFTFEVCAQDQDGYYKNCVEDTTKVKIEAIEHRSPIISRKSWKAGEIKYFNLNDHETYEVSIKDGDYPSNTVEKVVIQPESIRKFVSFKNGKIKVKFSKPGIYQFSLTATSVYNMSASESFVAEVFPSERSKKLYFSESTRTPEVGFYTNTIGDVQIMNPILQHLNRRDLSGRDMLILGTDSLLDRKMSSYIEEAMNKIDDIVIATSKIENMPDSFLDDLQGYHHIALLGRYQDLPNIPDVKELRFITKDDFQAPKDIVGLHLNSTTDSMSPMIFSVGADRVDCVDVLDLTDKKENDRYKVGIVCEREVGGKYVILGTEFSDIKTKEVDKNLPKKWFDKMLRTSIKTRSEK